MQILTSTIFAHSINANFGSVIFAFRKMSNAFIDIDLQRVIQFVKCHFLYLLNVQILTCVIFTHLMNRKFWQCRFCVFTKCTVCKILNAFSGIDSQRILAKYAIFIASFLVFDKCANFDNDMFVHLIYREFWQCLFCVFTKYAFWQL